MTDADLVTLAMHFQAEGDVLTATAILAQMHAREAGAISDDALNELAWTKAKADGYCVFNGFDRAIPLYQQISATYEQALGLSDARTRASLADLGQCLYQDFQYAASLEVWSRLLDIQKDVVDADKKLTRLARRMIKNCETSLALATSARDLGVHLQSMCGDSTAPTNGTVVLSTDRLLKIACKFQSRGKVEHAKVMYERWIKARAEATKPDEEDFLQDQRLFAKFLLNSGYFVQASSIYSSLVLQRNRQNTSGKFTDALVEALSDSAECFKGMGQFASMKSSIELANQLRQQTEGEKSRREA
jgi:tetratricopeptide (TPR) repeat protein